MHWHIGVNNRGLKLPATIKPLLLLPVLWSSRGVPISYQDKKETIPAQLLEEVEGKLVVYTPAVPAENEISQTLKAHHLPFLKRSQMLGIISKPFYTVAVAGTHGKTTTSSMIGHLLRHSGKPCTAFIGGISQNYLSNFISPQ